MPRRQPRPPTRQPFDGARRHGASHPRARRPGHVAPGGRPRDASSRRGRSGISRGSRARRLLARRICGDAGSSRPARARQRCRRGGLRRQLRQEPAQGAGVWRARDGDGPAASPAAGGTCDGRPAAPGGPRHRRPAAARRPCDGRTADQRSCHWIATIRCCWTPPMRSCRSGEACLARPAHCLARAGRVCARRCVGWPSETDPCSSRWRRSSSRPLRPTAGSSP